MKSRLFIILAVLTITACQNSEQNTTEQTNLLSSDDIETQVFSVSANKDTILTGKAGTILTIEKNTFLDQNGNQASGQIKIEFKECLNRLDMVLGNLTTTSNGLFLESGGMIYINATSNNQQLAIANNKTIGVEMPTDRVLSDMELFEGSLEDNTINWVDPSPINSEEGEFVESSSDSIQVTYIQDTIHKRQNVAANVTGFSDVGKHDEIPQELWDKIWAKVYEGSGMILSKDSSMIVDGYKVNLFKQDTVQEWDEYIYGKKWIESGTVNTYSEDKSTKYIFTVKKLGWANIDRLFNDPRTKEIELIVTVDNYNDYQDIYTSMIFKNQNMYLPGYQKKDKSFSFTHGDYEKTSLPVGETTTVLVTAYKDDRPYYAIKTFTIKDEQTIDLKLSVTTKDDLKKELEKKI